jgi:hypothetical protein
VKVPFAFAVMVYSGPVVSDPQEFGHAARALDAISAVLAAKTAPTSFLPI